MVDIWVIAAPPINPISSDRTVEGCTAMGVPVELLTEHLDVYERRDGLWNPDHGELELPDGWELLP